MALTASISPITRLSQSEYNRIFDAVSDKSREIFADVIEIYPKSQRALVRIDEGALRPSCRVEDGDPSYLLECGTEGLRYIPLEIGDTVQLFIRDEEFYTDYDQDTCVAVFQDYNEIFCQLAFKKGTV